MPNLPIVCDLTTLTETERKWLISEFRHLFNTVANVKALHNGYGFEFQNVDFDQFILISKLIALNRLCCPFIHHEIIQPAGVMDVWLHLTSQTDIKAYLRTDITQLVGKQASVIGMLEQLV